MARGEEAELKAKRLRFPPLTAAVAAQAPPPQRDHPLGEPAAPQASHQGEVKARYDF